jgi:hypothetical protein
LRCLSYKEINYKKEFIVEDCNSSSNWKLNRFGNKTQISNQDDPTKCIQLWTIHENWNGPNLLLSECDRNNQRQLFNYEENEYFEWIGRINHQNKVFQKGCLTVDDRYELEIWAGELMGNKKVLLLLNKGLSEGKIEFQFDRIGMSGIWKFRDLWKHVDIGNFQNVFEISLKSHESVIFLLEQVVA